MSNKTTFEDMAFDKVLDPMDRYDLIKKHDEEIEEKAQKNGKTFEEQLRADARWIINRKVEKGEIVLEEKP